MATETMIAVHEQDVSGLRSVLRKCFSFPVFLGTLIVAFNAAIMFPTFRMEPDTWWHLKYGDMILRTGRWPTVDTWSFTVHGMPVVAYEWAGEVVTALTYRLGGMRGLEFMAYALTSLILILLYYFAWQRCRNPKAAFIATVAVLPVAAMCFTLRPQLLGYIFLLITLICLESFRQGHRNALWVLPPLFLLWVNTHGSFVLGFMAMGLYWISGLVDFSSGGLHAQRWVLGDRIRLELAALGCLLVLPITPYGTRLATVPIEYAFFLPGNMADIQEWQPLNFGFWEAKLLLILLLAFIVAQVAFHLRYRLEELALFFLIAYLTFEHFRFAIIYAILFAPLAAAILSRWMPAYDPRIDKYAINAVLIFVALAALVWKFPSEAALQKQVARVFPVQAVRYLKNHPIPGRMFNDYFFGGYLVWAMAPRHKVFIDGRGDLYEAAGVFPDYIRIQNIKPSALAILRNYRIDSCLTQRTSPLATLLRARSGWKEIHKDYLSSLFVRIRQSKDTSAVDTARFHHANRGNAITASGGTH